MKSILVSVAIAALSISAAFGQNVPKKHLCPVILTTLYPRLLPLRSLDKLRRVEIRACHFEVGGNLQFAVWEDAAAVPSLVIETFDYLIVQLVMRGNICVIESARDAYDTVSVIVYATDGKPRIALQKTVRDPAIITADNAKVKVTLTAIRDQYLAGRWI